MRIHYLSCIETNAGWGSENFLSAELRRLGHDVIDTDLRKPFMRMKGPDDSLSDPDTQGIEALARKMSTTECDVLLVSRGGHHLTGEFFRLSPAPKRVLVYSELVARHPKDTVNFEAFDLVTVRSEACARMLLRTNCTVQNVRVFTPNFYDPALCRDISSDIQPDHDIIFIGAVNERRKETIDQLSRFFTTGYTNNAFGGDMVKVMHRGKLALNLHFTAYSDSELRLAEALGCRRVVLSERLNEDTEFGMIESIRQTDDLDDMIEEAELLLKDDRWADIRGRILPETQAPFTVSAKAQRLLELIEETQTNETVSG